MVYAVVKIKNQTSTIVIRKYVCGSLNEVGSIDCDRFD